MSNDFVAIVEKILDGIHGKYVVTKVEGLGSVTFDLSKSVWKEDTLPENGTYVVLSRLTKKRAGWRSGSARFYRPTDEITENKEQRA